MNIFSRFYQWILILVMILYYSFVVRCHHWGNWINIHRTSPYYFLVLYSIYIHKNIHVNSLLFIYLFKDFIYLFMRDPVREREAETQAEAEAGSVQGA